ncbi:uncharacterized protein LOC143623915 [Bidens hawaiensis]|uniref:uncharacterized protein LOC143623915 n=1 Tax=Bidens hawaiensis TaxID=980011 RepID=UPI00404B896E
MGLDSLPTLDPYDPGFSPFIDSYSFRHQYMEFSMRNKLDGLSRNPVEDRLERLQNRPIDRFQSEVLPPKSAKSVPITHHKMLSPIKSPGFILSRNAAYIMEAASKIIDPSPESTHNGRLPSFKSSSIPLRIRDLKERMEAEQKTFRIQETSQQLKACTPGRSSKSQPREKRTCPSEVVLLEPKIKSVSPSTPVKMNIQKLEGPTSRNRSTMKQKEGSVIKCGQLDKKQRVTPKGIPNRSITGKTHDVLTQNNQKQNSVSHKDRTNLKPRVPYQHYRKTSSTNGSSNEVKTSKKTVDNSAVGPRRKEFLSATKSFSGKKRPTDGNIMFDGTSTNSLLIKEKERSVKCNITIDRSSNWESVDRKNGIDVVSFTFTSPIKKPVSEAEMAGQSGVKSQGVRLKFDDQVDMGNTEVPSFGARVIDSDALSVLLEQKLKELSSLVETSECIKGGFNTHKDKNVISHDSDVSVDELLAKAKSEWQGIELAECDSNSENYGSGIKHPCTSPSVGPTLTDDSCITSNSTTTLTSNENKQHLFARNMELLVEEIELQDSATSLPTTIFEFTSMSKWSTQHELDYIIQIVNHAEFVLNDSIKVINDNLFNQLENQNKKMDPFSKPQRKALFDCVSVCLEGRRERALSGSYEEWSKWSMLVNTKALLAGEIHKAIRGLMSMEELMVDEVVAKDMSSGYGKWLDFEGEALEVGVVIGTHILDVLFDEIVVDVFLC